jgi:hypothetical protein
MKKTVFVLLSCLLVTKVFTQNLNTSFGLEVQPTFRSLYGRSSNITKNIGIGFSYGGVVHFKFKNRISFKTGVLYERKGNESELIFLSESGVLLGNTIYKSNYNYLIMPLQGYFSGPKEKWYFESGPYIGYLINRVDKYATAALIPGKSFDYTESTNRFDLGWSIGLGLNINLGDKVKMSIGIKESLGLLNTSNNELKVKTNSIGINCGIRYCLQ